MSKDKEIHNSHRKLQQQKKKRLTERFCPGGKMGIQM